jgi:hypothetical protein
VVTNLQTSRGGFIEDQVDEIDDLETVSLYMRGGEYHSPVRTTKYKRPS